MLLADKPEGYVFRVWVAGCASGEEAYSIAILLREYMDETQREFKIQFYATDLDEDAISLARTGLYPPNITADVTPERLRRFFVKEETGFRVKKDIREMIVFAIQNVIKDPPFTRLDLLSCRNLMIYLDVELQHRLLPNFHYALKPGGVLFLSPSESTGGHTELFAALDRRWKFYRTIHSTTSARTNIANEHSWTAETGRKVTEEAPIKRETNFSDLTKRVLLQSYAPASVLTDLKGTILYVHGETGKYLRPAPGQASLNVIDMAREGLQLELRNALHEAVSGTILNREIQSKTNGDFQPVSLSVRRLSSPEGTVGLLLISFQDTIPHGALAKRRMRGSSGPVQPIEKLERELAYTKENLQATIEEQQASNEELKSTNEELQSTNEELQSTNEELETSKEELQSVNEELITVNAELQAKIEQLAGMQNDMKNLLDNINVGTVFLDMNLRIRRFTREAERVYRLVSGDVGRPLADIKSDIEEQDLLADAQSVLDSLVPFEHEVQTTRGEWYLARIQPYRTLDNMIDGVVMTFTDISQRLSAESEVQAARNQAEAIVNTVREPLIVLDSSLRIVSASQSFYKRFKTSPEKTVGMLLYELGNRQWDIPELRELLEGILPQKITIEDYALELKIAGNGLYKLVLNAREVSGKENSVPYILLAIEEIRQNSKRGRTR
jgi:two-component system CheB/CheR fusion protein